MQENLHQPLKRRTLKDRLRKLKPSGLQLTSGFVVCAALAGGVWLYRSNVDFAGEPIVTVKIKPLEKMATASTPKNSSTKQPLPDSPNQPPVQPDPADLAADRAEAERSRVAIIHRPGRFTIRPLRRAPVNAVAERGPFGTLPKIAKNGRKPFDVYSAKIPHSILNSPKPKIALVIGGMGINIKKTNDAIRELPGQITFAFAPYGRGLQSLINKARRRGHEVILHIPMEPYGYPGINPGPKTLVANVEPIENLKNLRWLMSRFTGYSGVTNYMGAKFTADGGALLPIFSQFKSRGLVFFDDSSSGANLTGSIARAVKLPARRADIIIDTESAFTSIQQSLANLETLARKNGMAIGSGTGLPSTIDAVESWSRELQDRGIILVPLSAAYRGKRT
jgi:polysaccharide deacetylase 2 family uncharacterized protein YibQ